MRKRIKNTCIYVVVRLLMAFLRRLSLARSQRFGAWIGRRVYRWARVERERMLQNLAQAFPEWTEQERGQVAQSVFMHFASAVAEVVNVRRIRSLTDFMEMDPASRQILDDLLARGKGVVFVTAHVGNWELMARALARYGFPINTIGKRSYDPRFTRLMQRFRDEGAVRTIWRGDAKTGIKMLSVLRRGEIMGLLIDQDTKVPGTFVPFFGRLAFTPTAAALVARKTHAPMVAAFNHRRPDGGYRIVVQQVLASEIEDENQAIEADTKELTARIEAHIRQYPAEWVWMHRRWRTRPEDQEADPGSG